MSDDVLDPRFERDLRAMLAASEPGDVPVSLYAAVAGIPRPEVTAPVPLARGWDRRALAVLGLAAVLAIVAVGIGSGIVRLPGILPLIGAPTAVPATQTYRLYYEVTPLDRHTPSSDELQRALDVLTARAAAYQGTATGAVLADIPNTVAVDVVVPADDPGRLAELRAVLPIEGGLIIGTLNDGPIEIGASADGRDFEPALGSGTGLTPTLRPDGSALDLAVEPGIFTAFSGWASAHPGGTGVITTSDFVVLALAPITVPPQGGAWAIPFTPEEVAAGIPRKLLALFSSSSMRNPVREVAPRGVALAPGITPEPVPTPSPTVAPGNELHLKYQVVGSTGTAAVIAVLSDRIRATGIMEFGASGNDGTITITLPVAADDPQQARRYRRILGTTGRLDFVPLGDTPASDGEVIDLALHPPLLWGDPILSATLGYDQTGQRTLDFILGPEGAALFADHTAQHVGQYLAIVLDGTAIAVPVINEPIPNGQVQITIGGLGGYAEAEAEALVAILAGGPLPASLREVGNNAQASTPSPVPPAVPAILSVAGYVAACPAVGGCSYALELRGADAQWRADLAADAGGQISAGAGLPATLESGYYSVTATARRNPDSIAGGMGNQGPVDATCSADFAVAAFDEVMLVSVTFTNGFCEIRAGVLQP